MIQEDDPRVVELADSIVFCIDRKDLQQLVITLGSPITFQTRDRSKPLYIYDKNGNLKENEEAIIEDTKPIVNIEDKENCLSSEEEEDIIPSQESPSFFLQKKEKQLLSKIINLSIHLRSEINEGERINISKISIKVALKRFSVKFPDDSISPAEKKNKDFMFSILNHLECIFPSKEEIDGCIEYIERKLNIAEKKRKKILEKISLI